LAIHKNKTIIKLVNFLIVKQNAYQTERNINETFHSGDNLPYCSSPCILEVSDIRDETSNILTSKKSNKNKSAFTVIWSKHLSQNLRCK